VSKRFVLKVQYIGFFSTRGC